MQQYEKMIVVLEDEIKLLKNLLDRLRQAQKGQSHDLIEDEC